MMIAPSGVHQPASRKSGYLALMGILLLSLNCAGLRPGIDPDPGLAVDDLELPRDNGTIYIQYLGSGGNLIYRNGHGVLTAPIYSNPSTLRVGFGSIKPDTHRINLMYPGMPVVKVEAILVGHAHYDHLLDVPHIAERHAPEAAIYGNASVHRIMTAAGDNLGQRTHILDEKLSRDGRPGEWIYLADSTLRFMGIESDHGPHALGIHVMQGEVRDNLTRMPRSAWAWKEGQTIAYLVDFLGPNGEVEFRIHYQDATSHYPLGAPPVLAPPDAHRLDVAIVAVGSWRQTPDYPDALLRNHRPGCVFLGHWETFFCSPVRPPKPLPLSSWLAAFVRHIEANLPDESHWLLPTQGPTYAFLPGGSAPRQPGP